MDELRERFMAYAQSLSQGDDPTIDALGVRDEVQTACKEYPNTEASVYILTEGLRCILPRLLSRRRSFVSPEAMEVLNELCRDAIELVSKGDMVIREALLPSIVLLGEWRTDVYDYASLYTLRSFDRNTVPRNLNPVRDDIIPERQPFRFFKKIPCMWENYITETAWDDMRKLSSASRTLHGPVQLSHHYFVNVNTFLHYGGTESLLDFTTAGCSFFEASLVYQLLGSISTKVNRECICELASEVSVRATTYVAMIPDPGFPACSRLDFERLYQGLDLVLECGEDMFSIIVTLSCKAMGSEIVQVRIAALTALKQILFRASNDVTQVCDVCELLKANQWITRTFREGMHVQVLMHSFGIVEQMCQRNTLKAEDLSVICQYTLLSYDPSLVKEGSALFVILLQHMQTNSALLRELDRSLVELRACDVTEPILELLSAIAVAYSTSQQISNVEYDPAVSWPGVGHMLRLSFVYDNVSKVQHDMIIDRLERVVREYPPHSTRTIREWLLPRCFEGLKSTDVHEATVCARIISISRNQPSHHPSYHESLQLCWGVSQIINRLFSKVKSCEQTCAAFTSPTEQFRLLIAVLFSSCKELAKSECTTVIDQANPDQHLSTKDHISSTLDAVLQAVSDCSVEFKEIFFSCAKALIMQTDMWKFYGEKLFNVLCTMPTNSFDLACYECFAKGMIIANNHEGAFLVLEDKHEQIVDAFFRTLRISSHNGFEKLTDLAWNSTVEPVVQKSVQLLCLLMLYQPFTAQDSQKLGLKENEVWIEADALSLRKRFIETCCNAITCALDDTDFTEQTIRHHLIRGMRLLRKYFSLLMSSCFVLPDILVAHEWIVRPHRIKMKVSYLTFPTESAGRDWPSVIVLSQAHTVGMLRRAIVDRMQVDRWPELICAGQQLQDNRASLQEARLDNDALLNVVLQHLPNSEDDHRNAEFQESTQHDDRFTWPDLTHFRGKTPRDAVTDNDSMFVAAAEVLQMPDNRLYSALFFLADNGDPAIKDQAWTTLQFLPTWSLMKEQLGTTWLSHYGWPSTNPVMNSHAAVLTPSKMATTQYTLQLLLAYAEDHATNFDSFSKCQSSPSNGATWCKTFCSSGGWAALGELLKSTAEYQKGSKSLSADNASTLSLILRVMSVLISAHEEDISFLVDSGALQVDKLLWALLAKLLRSTSVFQVPPDDGSLEVQQLNNEVVCSAWSLLQEVHCRHAPISQDPGMEALISDVVWYSLLASPHEREGSAYSTALRAILRASVQRGQSHILISIVQSCLGYLMLPHEVIRKRAKEQELRAAKLLELAGEVITMTAHQLCLNAMSLGKSTEEAIYAGFVAAACGVSNEYLQLHSSLVHTPQELAVGMYICDKVISHTHQPSGARVVCVEALLGFLCFSIMHFPCCETDPFANADTLFISLTHLLSQCVGLADCRSKEIIAQGFILQRSIYNKLTECIIYEMRQQDSIKRPRDNSMEYPSDDKLEIDSMRFLTAHVLHSHFCPGRSGPNTNHEASKHNKDEQLNLALSKLSTSDLQDLLACNEADKELLQHLKAPELRNLFHHVVNSSVVEAVITRRLFVQPGDIPPLNIARTRDCQDALLHLIEVICEDNATATLIVVELLRTQLQSDVILACNAAAPAYLVREDDGSSLVFDDALSRHKPSHGLVGLVNMGNTCYMNSILQQLNGLAPFRDGLLNDDGGYTEAPELHSFNDTSENDKTMLVEIKATLRALSGLLLNAHDPRSLIKAFADVLPIENVYQQQDADEFLCTLLDQVEKALKYTSKYNLVRDLFVCDWAYISKCENCGRVWDSVERRYKIDLDIKNHSNVTSALASLMTNEEIHDFRCEHCNTVANITRAGYFRKMPPVLTLHLKRFDFDMQSFSRKKIYQYCAFPVQDSLTVQVQDENGTSTVVDYELTGVVVHSGSADHGHYYSFIKCPSDRTTNTTAERQWFKFDDRTVMAFDITRAELQWFGGRDENQQQERRYSANILFYTRKDQVEYICRRPRALYDDQVIREINYSFLRDVMALSVSLFEFVQLLFAHIYSKVKSPGKPLRASVAAKWKLALVSGSRLLTTFVLCTRMRVIVPDFRATEQLIEQLSNCLPFPPDTTDLPPEWQQYPEICVAVRRKRAKLEHGDDKDDRGESSTDTKRTKFESKTTAEHDIASEEVRANQNSLLFFAFMPFNVFDCIDGKLVCDHNIGYDVMDTKRWLIDHLSNNLEWLKIITSYSKSGFGRNVSHHAGISKLLKTILGTLIREDGCWQCEGFSDLTTSDTQNGSSASQSTFICSRFAAENNLCLASPGTLWPYFDLSRTNELADQLGLEHLMKGTAATLRLLSSIPLPCGRGEISLRSPTITSSNPLLRFVVALCEVVAGYAPGPTVLDPHHSSPLNISRSESDIFNKLEVIVLDDAEPNYVDPNIFQGLAEEPDLIHAFLEDACMAVTLLNHVAKHGTHLSRIVMIRAGMVSKLTTLISLSTQHVACLTRSDMPLLDRVDRLQLTIKAAWVLLVTLLRSTCSCVRELSTYDKIKGSRAFSRLNCAVRCSWTAEPHAFAFVEDTEACDDLYESEDSHNEVLIMATLTSDETNQILSIKFLREALEADREILPISFLRKTLYCILHHQCELWKITLKKVVQICTELATYPKIGRKNFPFTRATSLIRFLCSEQLFLALDYHARAQFLVEDIVSQLVSNLDSHDNTTRLCGGLLTLMLDLVSNRKTDAALYEAICEEMVSQLRRFMRKIFAFNCDLSSLCKDILRHLDSAKPGGYEVRHHSGVDRNASGDDSINPDASTVAGVNSDWTTASSSVVVRPELSTTNFIARPATDESSGHSICNRGSSSSTGERTSVYEIVFDMVSEILADVETCLDYLGSDWIWLRNWNQLARNGSKRSKDPHVGIDKGPTQVCAQCVYSCWRQLISGRQFEADLFSAVHAHFLVKLLARNAYDGRSHTENFPGDYFKGEMICVYSLLAKKHRSIVEELLLMPKRILHRVCDLMVYSPGPDPRTRSFHNDYTAKYYRFLHILAAADKHPLLHLGQSRHILWATEQFATSDGLEVCDAICELGSALTVSQKYRSQVLQLFCSLKCDFPVYIPSVNIPPPLRLLLRCFESMKSPEEFLFLLQNNGLTRLSDHISCVMERLSSLDPPAELSCLTLLLNCLLQVIRWISNPEMTAHCEEEVNEFTDACNWPQRTKLALQLVQCMLWLAELETERMKAVDTQESDNIPYHSSNAEELYSRSQQMMHEVLLYLQEDIDCLREVLQYIHSLEWTAAAASDVTTASARQINDRVVIVVETVWKHWLDEKYIEETLLDTDTCASIANIGWRALGILVTKNNSVTNDFQRQYPMSDWGPAAVEDIAGMISSGGNVILGGASATSALPFQRQLILAEKDIVLNLRQVDRQMNSTQQRTLWRNLTGSPAYLGALMTILRSYLVHPVVLSLHREVPRLSSAPPEMLVWPKHICTLLHLIPALDLQLQREGFELSKLRACAYAAIVYLKTLVAAVVLPEVAEEHVGSVPLELHTAQVAISWRLLGSTAMREQRCREEVQSCIAALQSSLTVAIDDTDEMARTMRNLAQQLLEVLIHQPMDTL